jgi:hypothetical protein
MGDRGFGLLISFLMPRDRDAVWGQMLYKIYPEEGLPNIQLATKEIQTFDLGNRIIAD